MKLPPSKWRNGSTIVENFHSAYAQLDHASFRHHQRRKSFISKRSDNVECPECKGARGWIEVVTDYGQGPWYACATCEGEGVVTKGEFEAIKTT